MTPADPDAASAYDEEAVGRLGKGAFLQGLVDNTSDGLITIDAASTIVFANPAVDRIFGYRPDELVGEPLTTLVPERLRQRHLDAIERYLRTDERQLDWDSIALPGLHRDGHEVPLEISFREVRQEGERLFTGIVKDVTDRKRAESERRLLYSVSRAVAEAETVDDGLQGAIEQVCNATEWGYGEGWVPSAEGDELERTSASYAATDALEPFQAISEVTAFPPGTGLPGRVWTAREFEWMPDVSAVSREVFPRTDTARDVGLKAALGVPVVSDGEVVAVLAFYMDERRPADDRLVETVDAVASELGGLIARKRAEVRLERERERLDRVLETSPVGIYLVASDGELVHANARTEELFGGPDLTARPYARPDVTVHDADGRPVPAERQPVARVLQTGEAVRDVEHRLETADGTRRWVSVNAAPIPGPDDEPPQVVVALADVTERREYRRALERERDELRTELDEVLERVSDAFFAVDADWRFTYVNERAATLLERPRDELVGESVWEQLPDAAGSTYSEAFERAMETQEPAAFEEYFSRLEKWFAVSAYPSETGLSVYFRDVTERKEHEATLRTLHEATRDLVRATSAGAVGDLAVETATEVIDMSGAAVYRFDPAESVLEPVACSDELREVLGELPRFAPGEGIAGRVFVEGTPAVHDDVRESEHVYNPETAIRGEILVPLGDHGVFIAGSTEPGGLDERSRELVRILATTTETALDRVEREEALRERDRELRERNQQLTRLNQINRVIRRIDQVLVDASTREEIEGAVCERLVEAGPFEFAWVGEHDRGEDAATPRSWAGDGQGYLDVLPALARDGDASSEPATRAVHSREPVAVPAVSEGLREEPWRQEALTRGFQSVVAVPLLYDGFLYGVLTVCASESGVFDGRTVEVFDELGAAIANGINAVETKQGLLFDRVVELDVRITDTDDVLHGLAAGAGCDVEFEGLIPRAESALVFFATSGVEPDRVRALCEERASVNHLRLVAEGEEECLFEAVLSDALVASTVVDHGGAPRAVTTDGSELRAVVDLPHTTDVRDFVERLRHSHPDAELVARRERERSVETRHGFRAELEERLTDRQLEVLRTAYLSGFFEEPRTSTGREVGAALDITQPTFNSHLRAAQRRLLSMLFDHE